MKHIVRVIGICFVGAVVYAGLYFYNVMIQEKAILKEIIHRLEADTRIAEVMVTDVTYNSITQKNMTTIKFLEYDGQDQPLTPKLFTFSGNIIQFQSLVIRFDDDLVKKGDALKGKSAYIFWKVFMLDGANTQEYDITPVDSIPEAYVIKHLDPQIQESFWKDFWDYALDSKKAKKAGIKNAQIEAPGSKFIPGILYTLKIEHDGGIRIDTSRIPDIFKGEKIL
jgi:hypothetical protein